MTTKRKIDHSRNISSETPLRGFTNVKAGDLITFNYKGKDIYDRRPLIMVLYKEGTKKGNQRMRGINLNYLKDFVVGRLLKETNFKNLKWYSLYENAFRTYSKSKMTMMKRITWKNPKISDDSQQILDDTAG